MTIVSGPPQPTLRHAGENWSGALVHKCHGPEAVANAISGLRAGECLEGSRLVVTLEQHVWVDRLLR